MQVFNFSTAKVAKFFRKVKKEAIKFLKKFFRKECKDSIFLPQRLQSFSQSSQ
jgi:hypothetical protein